MIIAFCFDSPFPYLHQAINKNLMKLILTFSFILFASIVVAQSPSYSTETRTKVENRVGKWQENGYLKLDLENEKAWIDPILWDNVDVDGKKEILATILVYTQIQKRKERMASFDFFNKNTGKQIASYSYFSGFSLE